MTAFAPVTRPRVQLWFGTRARGRNRHLIAGVAIIGTIVLMAIFAPLLTRYDPITISGVAFSMARAPICSWPRRRWRRLSSSGR
ncbi:hypothetical protein [Acidiphilium sp. 34-64-41]|uniref:hypothetical protein n=1 Tax=Acidiphilium sp. 34-64-41 TaxID=1970297 RepID=UPI000BDC5E9F|nr:hypothetical protein [Acidiphilium sp. 34-64-41]OZB23252.1 MAG: hypothetical protein B7X49_16315 [Acidiphilium sp. 34-64-41]